jgi:hypothetical protein
LIIWLTHRPPAFSSYPKVAGNLAREESHDRLPFAPANAPGLSRSKPECTHAGFAAEFAQTVHLERILHFGLLAEFTHILSLRAPFLLS